MSSAMRAWVLCGIVVGVMGLVMPTAPPLVNAVGYGMSALGGAMIGGALAVRDARRRRLDDRGRGHPPAR